MNSRLVSVSNVALMALLIFVSGPAVAQKAGQSVTVQYGVVTGGRQVDLQSGAVPAGVLVGGTLGIASASGRSSGKKARNAIVGAVAGAAVAGAARGSTTGMLYEIDLGAQGAMQVVTDQREVRPGDCVAVEKAGDTANLRRVSAAYCEKANQAAVLAVAEEAAEEAAECLAAKQQLVDAKTADEADLAARKIGLLCDD